MCPTYALVMAAGRGARMGGGENKMFRPVCGKPILAWTLETLNSCGQIEGILIVARPGEEGDCARIARQAGVTKLLAVAPGGGERQESVRLGLAALVAVLESRGAHHCGMPEQARPMVAIHDGARMLVTGAILGECIDAAHACGAAIACHSVTDTLHARGAADPGTLGETADRARFVGAETPQVFDLDILCAAHRAALEQGWTATDDADLVARLGQPVALVESQTNNAKITVPDDVLLAEAVLLGRSAKNKAAHDAGHSTQRDLQCGATHDAGHYAPNEAQPCSRLADEEVSPMQPMQQAEKLSFRVGQGFDAHRLIEGRQLILCGVDVPYERGLLGHSDADVSTHAAMDALLGALGWGDIGKLFPDTDERFRGADSVGLLREVIARMRSAGWRVGNLDITIICQKPKLAPFIERMREVIAGACGVPADRVSVKATTTEGMGFAGTGEGIAAMASTAVVRE